MKIFSRQLLNTTFSNKYNFYDKNRIKKQNYLNYKGVNKINILYFNLHFILLIYFVHEKFEKCF